MNAKPGNEGGSSYYWPLVVTGGPWPERIGKRCREVLPSEMTPGVYPFDKRGSDEIVVLIEDDPLGWHGNEWSCAMSRGDVSPGEQP